MDRRQFVQLSVLGGAGILTRRCGKPAIKGETISPSQLLGNLVSQEDDAPVKNAVWYRGEAAGDGLLYKFPAGLLTKTGTLTADMLLDGQYMTAFVLELEDEDGSRFRNMFFTLNQCSARIRLPLRFTDLNQWRLDREGAWMKQICGGDRIDLAGVDRMTLKILRKSEKPSRFCITPFIFSEEQVRKIIHPVLPNGPLLDQMGQSTLHKWPGKSRSPEQVTRRLEKQLQQAPEWTLPANMMEWGGWRAKRFRGTGFFRTAREQGRWWLVDPDGWAFWSAGVDCVRVDTEANFQGLEDALTWIPDPETESRYKEIFGRNGTTINYLKANFIRAFGPDNWYAKWGQLALAHMRRTGFNTVGNWSDWQIARDAKVPYVRPLRLNLEQTAAIYRDFPDVFHPSYEKEAETYAQQLLETRDDPALIGYFLMNEPKWGFSSELPAVGMLYNCPACMTRTELGKFLRQKYNTSQELSTAWAMDVGFDEIEKGRWRKKLSDNALIDLEAFSSLMAERYFRVLSKACRKVDPNHMNLGIRYQGVPSKWIVNGMKSFDVFSMNCYREKIPYKDVETIHQMLEMPVLIGEWHFGALDVGLPSSGIGRVRDQTARGQAYRYYLEDAAANPYCVGVHWFTLYDQSALGRFDGENYNIGFLDVCNRPYSEIGEAARLAHERMYNIADGREKPFDGPPEYLVKLFV